MDRSSLNLNEFTILLQRSVNRSTTNLAQEEQQGIKISNELRASLDTLQIHTTLLQATPTDEDEDEDTALLYNPTYLSNAFRNWHSWQEWWQDYENQYNLNTRKVWQKVRTLEDDAMGQP